MTERILPLGHSRRSFLAGCAGCLGAATTLSSGYFMPKSFASDAQPVLREYFVWDDESVIKFAETVFEKCVFDKIHPPQGELKRRWNAPGGKYVGQWLWDTMFVLDLLSIFDRQKEVIRDVFGNYRDFQERWNPIKPDYMHNMIANVIFAKDPRERKWQDFPAFSQIPILAWGLERVFNRNQDWQLLQENLGSLEKFHEWYWSERDVTNVGLVTVGDYNGSVQHARYETFDYDGTLDHLKLTPHPTRRDDPSKSMYGDILVVGNTSYLIMAERSLARLARIVGNESMAERREQRISKAVKAMRQHMWDEENGVFKAVKRDSLEKIDELSIGCWMPLIAEVPTKEMAKRMAEVLATDAWQTPLPVPTMPSNDPRFKPDGFWRGDVWTVTNYQIAAGIKAYGYDELAASIADATISNSMKNGVSEHHHALTGAPLGVDFLGMSCTVVTMMLDGLSKKYYLKLKAALRNPMLNSSGY